MFSGIGGAIVTPAIVKICEVSINKPENKSTSNDNATRNGPYSNIEDSTKIEVGKDFTATQKQRIIEENMRKNGGVVKSDLSGEQLVKPIKSQKGITPSENEWQIDHIDPKNSGGSNTYKNAQVLSRKENRIKWDK
ncbi:MAG: HNH endonuclease signature motif containing protein [Clostridia bacterium]|nr:HNH endonuclease signature motif containing protein [Clostridia bacterium]MDD4387234.1 HNH endonuclease signature motif containing protein [Clostridia bacterium]